MAQKVLILGASYGSLLGTKLAMAGHNATLVCRRATADLINREGTQVRIKLRDESEHRAIHSKDLNGHIGATTPEACQLNDYDLVVLAMQEPQYVHPTLRALLSRIARAEIPCLSIMNMPPLAFLKRVPGISSERVSKAYTDPGIWDKFKPGLMTLCSPDPQAFRPPEELANVLHVGLPTNFKAAAFENPTHTAILHELERDIDKVRLDGKEVPVKLRVFDSLFVPMAKWSMLMAGNYRCVTDVGTRSISEAVHSDIELSRIIFEQIDDLARTLGASENDLVPFEKYAKASKNLLKPSSVARAIMAGAPVERVDKLIQVLAQEFGRSHREIDKTVARIDAALAAQKATPVKVSA